MSSGFPLHPLTAAVVVQSSFARAARVGRCIRRTLRREAAQVSTAILKDSDLPTNSARLEALAIATTVAASVQQQIRYGWAGRECLIDTAIVFPGNAGQTYAALQPD